MSCTVPGRHRPRAALLIGQPRIPSAGDWAVESLALRALPGVLVLQPRTRPFRSARPEPQAPWHIVQSAPLRGWDLQSPGSA